MNPAHPVHPTDLAQPPVEDPAKNPQSASILHMPGDPAAPAAQDDKKETSPDDLRATLRAVYAALKEKGYNPVTQILGFILTGDPAYIPAHNNARLQLQSLDRNEILTVLLQDFFDE